MDTASAVKPAQLLGSSLAGAYLLEDEAETNRRPQRPTSLPIQPFVLVPRSDPGAPRGGCLLDQYRNQKSNKGSSSQPGSIFKGKRSRCFSSLQLSPMGSHYPVFLEPPSSSDTCSSCTPSPEWVGRRHTWSQSGGLPEAFGPCASKSGAKQPQVQALEGTSRPAGSSVTPPPSGSTLIKIPTYQDLNLLSLKYASGSPCPHGASPAPPTLAVSAHSRGSPPPTRPKPEPLPPRAAPAAHPGRTSPPGDLCLSPDTSYESMSISHLQRRGEMAPAQLASASPAVLLPGLVCSPR